MKESEIRKKAISELEQSGFKWWWYPTRPHFTAREWDIMGIYDIMAFKAVGRKAVVVFVQYTTRPNVNARIKKITAAFEHHGMIIKNSWVWGWDKKKHYFFKVRIDDGKRTRTTTGQSGGSSGLKPRPQRRVLKPAEAAVL